MDRGLAGEAAIALSRLHWELVGGAAFMPTHPLERMFLDVQGRAFSSAEWFQPNELSRVVSRSAAEWLYLVCREWLSQSRIHRWSN
jgi:alkylation response protein AidB-like acyl-CoA dehydrogenase